MLINISGLIKAGGNASEKYEQEIHIFFLPCAKPFFGPSHFTERKHLHSFGGASVQKRAPGK
jgi:hypothetical protein